MHRYSYDNVVCVCVCLCAGAHVYGTPDGGVCRVNGKCVRHRGWVILCVSVDTCDSVHCVHCLVYDSRHFPVDNIFHNVQIHCSGCHIWMNAIGIICSWVSVAWMWTLIHTQKKRVQRRLQKKKETRQRERQSTSKLWLDREIYFPALNCRMHCHRWKQ